MVKEIIYKIIYLLMLGILLLLIIFKVPSIMCHNANSIDVTCVT